MSHLLNEFFFLFFCLQNVYKLITTFLLIFVILNYLTSLFVCVCGFVYSVGGDADSEIITFLPIFDWLPKYGNIVLFPWLSSPYVGQVPQVHCCI